MSLDYSDATRILWRITLAVIFSCAALIGLLYYLNQHSLQIRAAIKSSSEQVELARQMDQKGQSFAARRKLNSVITSRPNNPEAWMALAQSWENEGFRIAWWGYYRAAMLAENSRDASVRALRLLSESPVDDIMLMSAIELSAKFPHDLELQLYFAKTLVKAKRFRDADDVLSDLNRLYPQNEKVLRERIALHSRGIGVVASAARDTLQEFLNSTSDSAEKVWALRAWALSLLSSYSSTESRLNAIQAIDRAVELDKDNWDLRVERFSIIREYAPERLRAEVDSIWQFASQTRKFGRMLECIHLILDLPSLALSYIRQISPTMRTEPETAYLECLVLQGNGAWAESLSIAEKFADSTEASPLHRMMFGIMAAKAIRELKQSEIDVRMYTDQALSIAFSQNDRLLAIWGGVVLTSYNLRDHALGYLNMASMSSGEARYLALRNLIKIWELVPVKNLDDIFNELHRRFPKDTELAFVAANVFLTARINLPTALAMAEFAHQSQPNNIEYADTYARALAANNRRSEALSVYMAMPPTALEDRRIRNNMEAIRMTNQEVALKRNIEPTVSTDMQIRTEKTTSVNEVFELLNQDPKRALDLAGRLHNSNPRNLWVIHAFVMALARDNQLERAVELISPPVVAVLPKHPDVLLDFAEVLAIAKRHDRCLEVLDLIDPDSLDPDFREKHSRLHAVAQRELLTAGG